MKSKIIILMLSGLIAGSLAVSAQDNPPAGVTQESGTSTNATVADPSATPAPAASDATAPAAADTTAAVPAVDATAPAADATAPAADATATTDTNAVATDVVVPADTANGTNTTRRTAKSGASEAIIPLIVMDEVPLADAIKNLARQANLNYMLDPKLSFAHAPAEGRPGPAQPTVSIRWENITAEQALTALLNNYSLQLVDDPKTKIARVTVKDPAAPDPLVTRIIQLKFTSPNSIISSAQAVLTDKRSKVMGDIRTSQLVVLSTEREFAALSDMIERLDTPTRQVLIEGRLLETSMNPESIKGLNWAGTLQAQKISVGNNLHTKPVTQEESANPVLTKDWPKLLLDTAKGFNPGTAFLDADGVSAVFSFINQNSEAKVLSAPRTVTLDNEPAKLSVTRASPIINVTAGTANTTGGSQVTYTNLGVILDVTPRISANNYINLKVVPEVSRIFGTVEKIIDNKLFQADEYDVRKIETTVMIPSGNTLVLGGLVQDDIRKDNTKVPGLGDLPLLGRAFRSESKARQKNNLLIFITPTIVQDSDFQPTQTDFLKSAMTDTGEKEWSTWDSGKPYDWSRVVRGGN